MRKFLAAGLVAIAALAMGTADAGHGARSVEGTILVPTADGVTRHARCAYELGGEDSNGYVGWVVALDVAEGDGNHTFSLTSDTEGADMGVVWYESLGTCDNGPAPVTVGDSLNPGDESGTIPAAAAFAIIIVELAVDADFTFSIA